MLKRLFSLQNSKRRTRDSNPQPIARYFSSSEAAHQFAYPPAILTSLVKTRQKYLLTLCLTVPIFVFGEASGDQTANRFNRIGFDINASKFQLDRSVD